VTSTREAFSLGGVVLAASLPVMLASDTAAALQLLAWLFVPLLGIAAIITLRGAPSVATLPVGAATSYPWQILSYDQGFRRLLTVLAVGGVASAIPATLVLFFIADVLQLESWQGGFLAIYFISGGLALPLWVSLARHIGKVRTWIASMLLAIVSFVWAFLLATGDGIAFAIICAASGAALGAELALPPALLADRLADGRYSGKNAGGAGAYFGIWNFVTKFNLALAAGIALPLVSFAGYRASSLPVGAGDTLSSYGLLTLSAVYALLPALLKTVSLLLLWRWRDDLEGENDATLAA
jgi:Na+/melibiose symporter-like transporter